MARILVIADHQDGDLKKSTLQTLTLAREIASRTGGGFSIAVIGSGVGAVANQLTSYGAERVLVVDAPAYAHYLAENTSKAVAALAKQTGASFVLSSTGTTGKDMLPRVAAQLGQGMVADCVGLAGEGATLLYKRPMYAGNIIATVRVNTPGAVISVRGSEFAAAAPSGGASPVESASVDGGTPKASFVKFDGVKSERPELTEADIVVSGGRGLKDGDQFFAVMEPLADALGAAIGASRAAVDSGFCPNDFQVGQTGKVVAPKLYIAVAISGAIQHLAGMKNSKCIVAINKDPEAPIFQVADYGLVGDAFKLVPELAQKAAAARS
jgi:electron transfer flavoprotein alpha subunit